MLNPVCWWIITIHDSNSHELTPREVRPAVLAGNVAAGKVKNVLWKGHHMLDHELDPIITIPELGLLLGLPWILSKKRCLAGLPHIFFVGFNGLPHIMLPSPFSRAIQPQVPAIPVSSCGHNWRPVRRAMPVTPGCNRRAFFSSQNGDSTTEKTWWKRGSEKTPVFQERWISAKFGFTNRDGSAYFLNV